MPSTNVSKKSLWERSGRRSMTRSLLKELASWFCRNSNDAMADTLAGEMRHVFKAAVTKSDTLAETNMEILEKLGITPSSKTDQTGLEAFASWLTESEEDDRETVPSINKRHGRWSSTADTPLRPLLQDDALSLGFQCELHYDDDEVHLDDTFATDIEDDKSDVSIYFDTDSRCSWDGSPVTNNSMNYRLSSSSSSFGGIVDQWHSCDKHGFPLMAKKSAAAKRLVIQSPVPPTPCNSAETNSDSVMNHTSNSVDGLRGCSPLAVLASGTASYEPGTDCTETMSSTSTRMTPNRGGFSQCGRPPFATVTNCLDSNGSKISRANRRRRSSSTRFDQELFSTEKEGLSITNENDKLQKILIQHSDDICKENAVAPAAAPSAHRLEVVSHPLEMKGDKFEFKFKKLKLVPIQEKPDVSVVM